ncbi:hypothetical protein CSA37_03215 [Candidatus Fermentibacteria bacterium]|nr:MAG: hypothetical protein CSA37_03215 [Candidatus Fermentibacteria bacterium]
MSAPAGLCRIERLTVQLAGAYIHGESAYSAAAVLPFNGRKYGLGAGFHLDGNSDCVRFRLAGAYVITGDPIGFMEGLFGPSITAGFSAGADYYTEADSIRENLDCGFQFSLFPSFALGMTLEDVTDDRILRAGFSHVFNRYMTAHVNYGKSQWQGGAELHVSSVLSLTAGTDGELLNSGLSWTGGNWQVSYSASLSSDTVSHSMGILRRWE